VKSSGNARLVRLGRIVLGLAGAGTAAYGLLGLPTQLGPAQLVGLLTWMALAVLLHDGVIVPLSTLAGAGLTRLGFGLRPISAAVLRGALMTGAVVTMLVGVLVKAQSEARNVSVLEANYAANLAWFWAVLALVAAVVIYGVERTGSATGDRRQKTRP
jgi:membrane-bound ClpP family serine protease